MFCRKLLAAKSLSLQYVSNMERLFPLTYSKRFSNAKYRKRKNYAVNHIKNELTVKPAFVDLSLNSPVSNETESEQASHFETISELNKKISELTKDLNVIRQETDADKIGSEEIAKGLSKKKSLSGTPDKSIEMSSVQCGGCGALLHCQDVTIPGYLPSEVFKNLTMEELKESKCQKCHKMQHQGMVFDIRASDEKVYEIMRKISSERCLVLLVIDLFDIENSIPDIFSQMLTERTTIHVIGNKVDIIPQDQPNYLEAVEETLITACKKRGLNRHNVKEVSLISAKTGYGVEKLISSLLANWGMRGNVYMIGTANSGKSTLYNSLLHSDYCYYKVRDVIPKASVSVWPGTTINILKFPIMNSKTNWLMKMRQKRLMETQAKEILRHKKMKEEIKKQKKLVASSFITTLHGKVEKTDFTNDAEKRALYSGFDLVAYEYKGDQVRSNDGKEFIMETPEKYDETDFTDSRFLCDTPGLLCDNQVHTELTPEELKLIIPTRKIVPHCYLLKPDHTVFITGLGRIDFVEGNQDVMLVIFISSKLPVFVLPSHEAEEFYHNNIGTNILGVPLGDESRLTKLPPLKSEDIRIHLQDHPQKLAALDLQLSSLGWVSVIGMARGFEIDIDVTLRVYTPGALGIFQRPPMLREAHAFHRKRMGNSFKYRRNKSKLLLSKGERL
ncbi:nitric oxide-associated protein 1-like isoform X2 [Saccostrea cucullata]|uniref:nitric oxide-associated protein 1-like isoform X2 n=1 Tax=Saccostrea cuccullata TaxID=36930 RepID=UPI002ED333CD